MGLLFEIPAFIGMCTLLLLGLGLFQGFFEEDITEKRVDDFKEGDYDEKN